MTIGTTRKCDIPFVNSCGIAFLSKLYAMSPQLKRLWKEKRFLLIRFGRKHDLILISFDFDECSRAVLMYYNYTSIAYLESCVVLARISFSTYRTKVELITIVVSFCLVDVGLGANAAIWMSCRFVLYPSIIYTMGRGQFLLSAQYKTT